MQLCIFEKSFLNIMGTVGISSKSLDFNTFLPLLNQLKENVSVDDIDRIATKIGGKRIGKLREVWDQVLLLKNYITNEEIKLEDKILPIASLAYVIFPIDVIPDIAPVVGYGDDAAVILGIVGQISSKGLINNQFSSRVINNSIKKSSDLPKTDQTIIYNKILKAKFITSLMSHAANADDLMEDAEKYKIYEIIDYLLFSDEGGLQENKLNKEYIKKKFLQTELHSYFNEPISFNEIVHYMKENLSKEQSSVWYLYAYCIVMVDNQVKNSERYFLDLLAVKVGISEDEQKRVEETFRKEWFITQ